MGRFPSISIYAVSATAASLPSMSCRSMEFGFLDYVGFPGLSDINANAFPCTDRVLYPCIDTHSLLRRTAAAGGRYTAIFVWFMAVSVRLFDRDFQSADSRLLKVLVRHGPQGVSSIAAWFPWEFIVN